MTRILLFWGGVEGAGPGAHIKRKVIPMAMALRYQIVLGLIIKLLTFLFTDADKLTVDRRVYWVAVLLIIW